MLNQNLLAIPPRYNTMPGPDHYIGCKVGQKNLGSGVYVGFFAGNDQTKLMNRGIV
jgi:hypothetical protein